MIIIVLLILIMALAIAVGSALLQIRHCMQRITELDRIATSNVVDQERSHNSVHRDHEAYIAYLQTLLRIADARFLSQAQWADERELKAFNDKIRRDFMATP